MKHIEIRTILTWHMSSDRSEHKNLLDALVEYGKEYPNMDIELLTQAVTDHAAHTDASHRAILGALDAHINEVEGLGV